MCVSSAEGGDICSPDNSIAHCSVSFRQQHFLSCTVLFYHGDLSVLTAINGLRLVCLCKLLPIASGDLCSFSSKVTIFNPSRLLNSMS